MMKYLVLTLLLSLAAHADVIDSVDQTTHDLLDGVELTVSGSDFQIGKLDEMKVPLVGWKIPGTYSEDSKYIAEISVCSRRVTINFCSDPKTLILNNPKYKNDSLKISFSDFNSLGYKLGLGDLDLRVRVKASTNYGKYFTQIEKKVSVLEIIKGIYAGNQKHSQLFTDSGWGVTLHFIVSGEKKILPYTFQDMLSEKTLSFKWKSFTRDSYESKLSNSYESSFIFRTSICQEKMMVLQNCIQKESKSVTILNSKADPVLFGHAKKLADDILPLGFSLDDLGQLSDQKTITDSFVVIEIFNVHWTGINVKIASVKISALDLASALTSGIDHVTAASKTNLSGDFEISLKENAIQLNAPKGTDAGVKAPPILVQHPNAKTVPQILPSAPRTLDCGIYQSEIEQTKCLAINAYALAYVHLDALNAGIPNSGKLHLKEMFEAIMMSHPTIPIQLPPSKETEWNGCGSENRISAYEQGMARITRQNALAYSPKIYFCHIGWSEMNGWEREVDQPHYRAQTLIHEYSHAGYGLLGLSALRSDECIATLVEGEVTKNAYKKVIPNGYLNGCPDLPRGLFSIR